MPGMPIIQLNGGRQRENPLNDLPQALGSLMEGINKIRDGVNLPKDMATLAALKSDPKNIDPKTGGLTTEALRTALPDLKSQRAKDQINQALMTQLIPPTVDPYKQWEMQFKAKQEQDRVATEDMKEKGREARDAAREERMAKQSAIQEKLHLATIGASDERQRKALEAAAATQQRNFEHQEEMERRKEEAKDKAAGRGTTTETVTKDDEGKETKSTTTTKKAGPESGKKALAAPPSPGSALDVGTAKKYLDANGGDKAKASAQAKQDGWSF